MCGLFAFCPETSATRAQPAGGIKSGRNLSPQAPRGHGKGMAGEYGDTITFTELPADVYVTCSNAPGAAIALGRAERRKQERIMAKKTKPKKC